MSISAVQIILNFLNFFNPVTLHYLERKSRSGFWDFALHSVQYELGISLTLTQESKASLLYPFAAFPFQPLLATWNCSAFQVQPWLPDCRISIYASNDKARANSRWPCIILWHSSHGKMGSYSPCLEPGLD